MARNTAPDMKAQLVWQRRSRASLMRSTALQAAALAVLASPAAAQLSPSARPTGGQVSAGQASIANTAAKTTITQSSQDAAINWQSYNVGSAQTVQYKQPNAQSMTLNRVVGPDPSQIAGHILANGQIVLVNQSGVVFSKGAQVDTAGLVVSTAGITNQNFMAGKLVFDQAGHVGAAISNAGNITIRQAGLAALVAPQVANSGTITATLGRVILGGAETHTLDLYGDGLVALNVTGQVTKASLGGRQVTALVTNSGTILAPGGTVVLSAAAADGVVTNLVEAGGRIAAPSMGAQTGRVLVQGIGGGISIDGDVSASGIAAGTKGGQVVANATGAVSVGAGAIVDASGDAGGGVIALGTTAARAIGGASVTPTLVAQSVGLAAGSHVRANATRRGTGGRIAVLSQQATTQSGDIAARGGTLGGDGGWIEVSGGHVAFGGLLDAGAASGGKMGAILIDPTNLQLGGAAPTGAAAATTSYVDARTFNSFTGDVVLKADGNLTVAGAIATATNLLGLGGPAVSTLQLEGDESIVIKAAVNAAGVAVGLVSNGDITETTAGIITAASLSVSAGGAIALIAPNKISAVGAFDNSAATTLTGGVAFINSDHNPSTRTPVPGTDTLTAAGLTANGDITLDNAISLTLNSEIFSTVNGTTTTTPAGTITSGGNVLVSVSGTAVTGQGINLAITPDTLTVGASVTGENVALATTGTVAGSYTGTAFSQTAGTILAGGIPSRTTPVGGTISISTAMGALSIGSIIVTTVPASQTVIAGQSGATTLTALVGNITEVSGTAQMPGGSITTGTLSGSANTSGSGNLPGNANFAIANGNTISTLTGFTTAGNFALEDDSRLVVQALNAGGTIGINGPDIAAGTAADILIVNGAVTAAGDITLSNDYGIAELSLAAIDSTRGAVILASGGGILQETLSTMTGGVTASTGIILASKGGTDFGTDLNVPAFGTVTGMSLGGTITAGALSGQAYTGSASIVATEGSIRQTAGSLRMDTLFGSVSNSDTADATQRNLLLSVSSGNTISNINALTAVTGSLVVEDDVALNVDVLTAGPTISVLGAPGGVLLRAPGALTLSGSVTASGGISLENDVGIEVLGTSVIDSTAGGVALNSGGAIFVQKNAAITGAETAGTAITLSAGGSTVFSGPGTIHGISFDGVLTAGTFNVANAVYTGSMSLSTAAGDITEGADGSLLAGTLSGSAIAAVGSTGSATFTSTASTANSVTTLGNTISAIGSFSTAGNFALLDQSGLTVDTLKAGGNLTITGPASPGGVLLLSGSITAGGTALFSNALGVAELTDASVTDSSGAVTLVSSGGAVVQQAGSNLTAGALTLQAKGSTTFDSSLDIGTVAGVTFDGDINAGSTLLSATAGDINEGTTATLLSGTVVAQASGTLQLAPAFGNGIGLLSGYAHGGDVSVENDSAMTIGTLSATGAITVLAPTTLARQTGSLTIAGLVTAPDGVSLANDKGITERTGGTITSTGGTVSLVSADGAITQQAGSTMSGDTTGAAGTLVSLSADTGISFSGTIVAGTPGTTVPAGIVFLSTRTGDIVEGGTGSLQSVTLAGGAAAGSASFTSTAGNEIGTLTNFSVGGNFALEDNAGLLVLGQTSGGNIDIHGPTNGTSPAGTLELDGAITAPGNIMLSNALGVAQDPGTAIDSTAGGTVSLISDRNVTFGGTITAGTLGSAGVYTGSTVLTATTGNVTEGAQATLFTGSLTAVAGGHVALVGNSANVIGEIGSSSATGSFDVVDAGGLTLDVLHAGGDITVLGTASPTGILIIRDVVSTARGIDLSNALGIAELGTGRVASTGGAVSLTSSGGAFLQLANGFVAGGTASGAGTLVTITTGGSTIFGDYGVTAPTDPVAGISFGGTIASGHATAGLYSGTVSFSVSAGDIIESDSGVLRTAILTGSVTGNGAIAGDALFDTMAAPGNVVGTLTAFNVDGSFALEDDAGLTVLGQSAAGSIDIHGPLGGTPGGILVLDGAITAAGGITLDNGAGIVELRGADVTSSGAGVSITTTHGAFAQQTLTTMSAGGTQGISITADGGTDFATLLPGSGFASLSGINFNGKLDAGIAGIATLSTTSGGITEGRLAELRAGTLNGSTSGTANLSFAAGASATGSNLIASIGDFSSTGDIVLEDSAKLAIGTLTAGGNVDVHGPLTGQPGGSLTLTGILTARGGIVSLSNDLGISLGGTLTAGGLSGLVYTGLARLTTTTGDISETGAGSVRAGTLSGSTAGAGASAILDGSGNVVSLLTNFTTGGDFALADTAGLTIGTLTSGGGIDISGSGTAAPAHYLQIAGPVSAISDIAMTNPLGIVEFSGATVTTTGGSISLTATNGGILQQKTASLSAATGLSLDAGGSTAFGTLLTGQIPGTIDGISFAGRLVTGGSANFAAGNGNIVEQDTGVLQAGTVSAMAQTSGGSIAGSVLLASTSSLSSGNQVGTLAASSAAAGFGFVDGQALTVTGAVQAGGTSVGNLQIVAPAIDVTSGSLDLLAAAGVVDLVADHFVFQNAGAVSTPGGLVTLDLLNSGSSGTTFSVGGATISGASLSNIESHGGTLAIGQALNAAGVLTDTPNTGTGSWTLGAVGTVTAIDISQGVNFGNPASPSALGLFSDDVINVSSGITVGSLYGAAGSATAATGTASILGSNAIGTLGVVNDDGVLVGFLTQRAGASGTALQFQLADTVPLLVLGPIAAGQGAVKIGVTGAQNGLANALTIGSTIVPLSGQVSGTDVALAATGDISQVSGTIAALGAATGTNGTIAIASSAGAVTLDSLVDGATMHSALLLQAGGGNITEAAGATLTAGTLAASASGDISLGNAFNSFATVGSLASIADGITLYGLSAGGGTGIVLQNTKSLLIADDSVVGGTRHAVVSALGTDTAGIDIALATGSLSLGTASGATLEALGSVTLTAPGAIVQTGGSVHSFDAGVTLTTTAGSITQTGGLILADGGDALLTAPAGVTQTASSIVAAQNVVIGSSAGGFSQSSSSILGTHGVSIDVSGAITSLGGGTIASVGRAGDASSGTVALVSHSGSISFDGTIAGGFDPGVAVYTPSAGSAVLLSAAGGSIVEATTGSLEAGTLAASASGDISLGSGANHVANIGSLATPAYAPSPVSMPGLTAGGPTGILFVDDASLNILADTANSAGLPASPVVYASARGASITIDQILVSSNGGAGDTYGTFTIGAFGASTIKADGAITLDSTGTLSQGAGTIVSASGAISLAASNGDVTQTGGTVLANSGAVSFSASGDIALSSATLTAGGAAGLIAGGGISVDASRITAAGNLGANAGTGDIDETGGSAITGGGQVGLVSAQGGFNQSASSITGTLGVGLSFSGAVTSVDSFIASPGVAGDAASGTVSIAAGGGMVIDSQISAGPKGAVLLSAMGDITQASVGSSQTGVIISPVLAASAGGDLDLGGANQVQAIAALGPLTGLSAATGGIGLTDTVDLTLLAGASVSAPNGSIIVNLSGTAPASLVSNGANVVAADDVLLLTSGAVTQNGGLIQSGTGNVRILAGGGALSQSAGSTISAAQTLALQAAGDVSMAGTLAGAAVGISAGGAIAAPSATLLTGTLAALAGGGIDLGGIGNVIGQIGTVGTLTGLSGGAITVQDSAALIVAANVTGDGAVTITLPTADFTELPGVTIAANGPLGISAGGAMLLGGTLTGGATSLSAGGALTEAAGADITATTAMLSAGTSLTIDGTLSTQGTASLSAGTDFIEGPDALIEISPSGTTPSPLTLTVPGTITLDGRLVVGGPLSVIAGAFIEDATGSVTADATSITATSGAATLDGILTANGALAVSAFTDLSIGQGATVTGNDSSIAAVTGAVTVDGLLQAGGSLAVTAGTDVDLGPTGLIGGVDTTISAGSGTATLDGALTVAGTLAVAAGTDVDLGQTGNITVAGATTIAAGSGHVTLDGSLDLSGALGILAGTDITLDTSGNISASAATLTATGGAVTIDSTLNVAGFGPLGITAGTAFTLGAAGFINAGTTMITTGTGAATFDGEMFLGGPLSVTAGADFIFAPNAVIQSGDTTIAAGGAASLGGSFNTPGTFSLTAGTDVMLLQGAVLTAGNTAIAALGGSAALDGTLVSLGQVSLSAAGDVTQSVTGALSGSGIGISATAGSVLIAGNVTSANGFSIFAGTDITEAAGAVIAGDPGLAAAPGLRHALLIPSEGGSLTAGGTITIDGTLVDPLALTLAAGTAVTLDATGAITGGLTSITASLGAVTLSGPVAAGGALFISAGTDLLAEASITAAGATDFAAGGSIIVDGALASFGGLNLDAKADVTLAGTAIVTAPTISIIAPGTANLAGSITTPGALSISQGTTILDSATIRSGDATFSASGDVDLLAALTVTGTLGITAGQGVSFGAGSAITAGATSIGAGGDLSILGVLAANGTLSITDGGNFTEGATGMLTGGPITLASTGAVALDGTVSSGAAVTIIAGTNFSQAAGGALSGAPVSVTAKAGSAIFDGAFTSLGAFTIAAHTNITQGSGSTIADSRFAALGLSSTIAAPGTITLAGTLSASSLEIGDFLTTSPVTQSIIWDDTVVLTGSNATIHGATNSISIAAPLVPGKGALGVYTQSTLFQQIGTATVSAIPGTGPSSTLQVGIEGRGNAKFANLVAPQTQLLLVLEQGGSATGQVDTAGLNVYYTDGTVPFQPVVLHGEVGGRGGFAAAAVGFSHHLPNVNYQINGCPIESINCILLSPLLVPIVDPVNDYAEGTQRKRHQDDDALPNVGEEDY